MVAKFFPRFSLLAVYFAVPLLPCGLLGCGGEPLNKDVAQEQSPIFMGTQTYMYPEVGHLTGLPGSCTGTMISSRYVLTAAHCIHYAPVTALNGNFHIDVSSSESLNIPVTRGWAFRHVDVGVNDYLDDIALIELGTVVPPEKASAQNVSGFPTNTVTAIGYGCDEPYHNAGFCSLGNGGVKRFRVMAYDADYSRSGDSGGPVYSGQPGQSRTVEGVMSGSQDNFFTWNTVLASPWSFYDRMLGYMRSRNLAAEPGIDRPGMDLRMEIQPDYFACYSACQQDAWCKIFSYVPVNQQCWLKWAVPPPTANSYVYTAPVAGKTTLEWGADRTGPWGQDAWTPNAKACAVRCASDRYCRAWTWDLAGQSSGGTCRMKWKGSQPFDAGRSNIISGARGGINMGIDRPGGSWINWYTEGYDPERCQAHCEEYSQCTYWTLTENVTQPYCTIFQGTPPAAVGNEMVVSGVKGQEDVL